MESFSRAVMDMLLGFVCLIFASVACWLGAGLGFVAAATSMALLHVMAPGAASLASLLTVCGAVFGGVFGVLLILRVWHSQALQSNDPLIRGFARRLDALGRAIKRPR